MLINSTLYSGHIVTSIYHKYLSFRATVGASVALDVLLILLYDCIAVVMLQGNE